MKYTTMIFSLNVLYFEDLKYKKIVTLEFVQIKAETNESYGTPSNIMQMRTNSQPKMDLKCIN